MFQLEQIECHIEINVDPTRDVLQWAEQSAYLHSVVETDYNDLIDFAFHHDEHTESKKSSSDCSLDLSFCHSNLD